MFHGSYALKSAIHCQGVWLGKCWCLYAPPFYLFLIDGRSFMHIAFPLFSLCYHYMEVLFYATQWMEISLTLSRALWDWVEEPSFRRQSNTTVSIEHSTSTRLFRILWVHKTCLWRAGTERSAREESIIDDDYCVLSRLNACWYRVPRPEQVYEWEGRIFSVSIVYRSIERYDKSATIAPKVESFEINSRCVAELDPISFEIIRLR